MNSLISVVVLCSFSLPQVFSQDIFSTEQMKQCDCYGDLTYQFQQVLYDFAVRMLKKSSKSMKQFVIAPHSAWITIAAIAEATDPETKQALFQILKLPDEPCIRLKFYEIATSRYRSSHDVTIINKRALVIDKKVSINPIYHNFVVQNSLLQIMSAPIRHDPETALNEIRRFTAAKVRNLDLSGNSVILDVVDFKGLWSIAFEDAVIEKSPFYNERGEQIGTVDMMKVRRRVRLMYSKIINSNLVELGFGYNERYRLVFGLALDNNTLRSINDFTNCVLGEFLSKIRESYIPLDMAIPRVSITAENDFRHILEAYGVENLWKDPIVTRFISEPAAFPSDFVQRSIISLDKAGLKPAPRYQPSNDTRTGLDPILGREFILNRPFIFGLFDAETYTCLMTGGFFDPNN